ncbi:MAG: hypothetical protein QY326_08290 [Bdellovibrionota bacterium]|nr:MAG: hypothetical protein QY326_08290 [Bdellovibrionota bacterium]
MSALGPSFVSLPVREVRDLCGERETEVRARLHRATFSLDHSNQFRFDLQGPERSVSIVAAPSPAQRHYGLDIQLRCAEERMVALSPARLAVEAMRILGPDQRPVAALYVGAHLMRIGPLLPDVIYVLEVRDPPPSVLRLETPPADEPGASADDSCLGIALHGESFPVLSGAL